MTIEQYFGESKGDWPKTGVAGVESGWMDFGLDLPVPNGQLWVGDPWQVDDEQLTVAVPAGDYHVQVKGMDFNGHRRTARMRACLKGIQRPALGTACGETGTDVGVVGLCDIETFEKHVRAKHLKKYARDLEMALRSDGHGGIQFDYGRTRKVDGLMLTLPSGLGDGCFTVYALRKGTRIVGIEVEFLTPGFKLTRDIPRLG